MDLFIVVLWGPMYTVNYLKPKRTRYNFSVSFGQLDGPLSDYYNLKQVSKLNNQSVM